MAYNVTWMNNTFNIYDIFVNVNSTSDGVISSIILLIIGMFVLYNTLSNGFSSAVVMTGLVTGIIGTLLWWAGLLPFFILIIPILMLLIGGAIKWYEF